MATNFVCEIDPPVHTFDWSSRAVREISACGEKCNHRPIDRSGLLIGLLLQLLHAAGAQANK